MEGKKWGDTESIQHNMFMEKMAEVLMAILKERNAYQSPGMAMVARRQQRNESTCYGLSEKRWVAAFVKSNLDLSGKSLRCQSLRNGLNVD